MSQKKTITFSMIDSDLDLLSAAAVSHKLHTQKRKLKQKREPNWTLVEKETLRNICMEYMEVINNRRTDNEMCALKNRTWLKITEAMRESGYNRNVSRVREAYARMKKIDKGVVVLQLPNSKIKNINCNGGGNRIVDSRKGPINDGQHIRKLNSLPTAEHFVENGDQSYSADSESDESYDSPLFKSLTLRRQSNNSLLAMQEPRRPFGELQLKKNFLSTDKALPDIENQLGKQKINNSFEMDNLNLKTEVDSTQDDEEEQLSLEVIGESNKKQNQFEGERKNSKENEKQRTAKYTQSAPAGVICNHSNNTSSMDVSMQMQDGNETVSHHENLIVATEVDGNLESMGNDFRRKAELHRYQLSTEEKRLALLDLQLQQVRMQMRHERHLYEKDLETKQLKLELMRCYKKGV